VLFVCGVGFLFFFFSFFFFFLVCIEESLK